MGQAISVSGTIITGQLGAGDCAFPNAVTNLVLQVPQVPAPASFYSQKQVTAPAFAALDGIGSGKAVTKAVFLYLRTNGPVQLRITQQPDSGPDVPAIEWVDGTVMKKVPANNYIKLVEILGTATVEYLAAGNE